MQHHDEVEYKPITIPGHGITAVVINQLLYQLQVATTTGQIKRGTVVESFCVGNIHLNRSVTTFVCPFLSATCNADYSSVNVVFANVCSVLTATPEPHSHALSLQHNEEMKSSISIAVCYINSAIVLGYKLSNYLLLPFQCSIMTWSKPNIIPGSACNCLSCMHSILLCNCSQMHIFTAWIQSLATHSSLASTLTSCC